MFDKVIWNNIFKYVRKILPLRFICRETKIMIDNGYDMTGRKFSIYNSRILNIIIGITEIRIRNETIIDDDDDLIGIKIIHCNYWKNIEKHKFPSGLRKLYCEGSPVVNLSYLKHLRLLDCSHCPYITASGLPTELSELICGWTGIVDISGLLKLQKLYCVCCRALVSKGFPVGIIDLDCSFTNVSDLSYLLCLKKLRCVFCKNITMNGIPKNIENIHCEYTKIKNDEMLWEHKKIKKADDGEYELFEFLYGWIDIFK